MKKLVCAVIAAVMLCVSVMPSFAVPAALNENFLFREDPDAIGGFSYAKMNIDPEASTNHIEWKGFEGSHDWMISAEMDRHNYKTIDNVIQCSEQNKDSYVEYRSGDFAGKPLSFVAIYDNRLIDILADGDWVGWRQLYQNMPYKIYAGASADSLTEVVPTHFKTAAWQQAVYVEYMVKELPADAKVFKIVIPAWDNAQYADRKIGRITVSEDLNFTDAFVNPFKSFDANEACVIKLQKMYADGREITKLQEGNISALAVVANERSASINAALVTALYKNGVLTDVKTKAETMTSYKTAIMSTEDYPLNIDLSGGGNLSDYDVKIWVITDIGPIGLPTGIKDIAGDTSVGASKLTKYKLAVLSPEYTSEICGDTTIRLAAPGLTEVEAVCWKQDDKDGHDEVVAKVTLDADGMGSFVFPADEFPHGPITIRMKATAGTGRYDINNLQLYNIGGVNWKEGLAAASVPEVAKDLKVFYEDDFEGPLSISRYDSSATYCSHKISYGDFSGVYFRDFEDENISPFGQIGSYLRIRADENKNSSGLISTAHQDFSGIQVKAPAYFECRMIAPFATGTWPAIWFMTNNQGQGGPVDELDLLEAYGFDDDTATSHFNGFTTGSIEWDNDAKTPDVVVTGGRFPNMRKTGNGSSWFESFHTYGMYVGEDYTIYYLDNKEHYRHTTYNTSKKDPIYMMINLAIGGSSGWPKDLSRYNGVVDMYVDYIRIYN